MIITFGTQKGGVGKTTIAIALANYLSVEKKMKIQVYDYDFQQSLYQKWKDDEFYDSGEIIKQKLYDVHLVTTAEDLPFKNIEELITLKESEEIYLFDLGGKLDALYTDLLIYSDFIVVPIEYSDVTVHSTFTFVNLLGKLGSEAQMIFVRSKYEENYNYPNQQHTDETLKQYGIILETSVGKRNILQKINTRTWDKKQREAIKKTLVELINVINEISQTTI